ncbi:hypothetical protein [Lichenicola sp.]|uniref:hypothetical protein n=1 Tax=Lichenicola sp. TaxID=2804529 RepID=UPI003AFFFAF0
MSVHDCHSPESVGSAVGGAIGGLGQAAILAYALSRQDGDRRAAHNAACAEAGARGRANALARTNEDLRGRLADACADLGVAESENEILRRQVAALTEDRRILADAVRAFRRAA